MCGIAGIWSLGDRVEDAQLRRMGDQMASRGPDYQGTYLDSGANLGLVHQRLSIIDLDGRANQPMHSADGRYVIVFNGEIYNFQSRKRELMDQGVQFHTSSDTEVLLALFERHGPRCLDLLNGMFAFAIYDKQARELFIARDRLGIKPLYFYRSESCFAFSSDLKAFRKSEHIALQISQERIADFLLFEYIPQPHSIYANCSKLLPGHYMVLKSPREVRFQQYWDIPAGRTQSAATDADLVENFRTLFQSCVKRHLVSDVRVGAFLSGGLDSSAIVSQMQGDFSAFTIDFEGASNTLDRQRASELASTLGLQHRVTLVSQDSLPDFVGLIGELDEPISDQSIIGLHYNFAEARKSDIRVILTGDGADEILGGYSYFSSLQFVNAYARYLRPGVPLLRLAELCLGQCSATTRAGKFRDLYVKYYGDLVSLGSPAQRHLYTLSARSSAELQRFMPSFRSEVSDPIHAASYASGRPGLSGLLYSESKTSLVNRMLSKVDKTSMAHSSEARVPFLDHELVEFAFQLPDEMRRNKRILRLAMKDILPPAILTDTKRGFNLPVRHWVRHFILNSANAYLGTEVLLRNLPLTRTQLASLIDAARRKNADMSKLIWSLFVLSHWLESNGF